MRIHLWLLVSLIGFSCSKKSAQPDDGGSVTYASASGANASSTKPLSGKAATATPTPINGDEDTRHEELYNSIRTTPPMPGPDLPEKMENFDSDSDEFEESDDRPKRKLYGEKDEGYSSGKQPMKEDFEDEESSDEDKSDDYEDKSETLKEGESKSAPSKSTTTVTYKIIVPSGVFADGAVLGLTISKKSGASHSDISRMILADPNGTTFTSELFFEGDEISAQLKGNGADHCSKVTISFTGKIPGSEITLNEFPERNAETSGCAAQ